MRNGRNPRQLTRNLRGGGGGKGKKPGTYAASEEKPKTPSEENDKNNNKVNDGVPLSGNVATQVKPSRGKSTRMSPAQAARKPKDAAGVDHLGYI